MASQEWSMLLNNQTELDGEDRPAGRCSDGPGDPLRQTVDSASGMAPMNRKQRRIAAKAGRGANPAPTGASAFGAEDILGKAKALHESGRF